MAILLDLNISSTFKHVFNLNLYEYRGIAKCHNIEEFKEIEKIKNVENKIPIFKAFLVTKFEKNQVIYGYVYVTYVCEYDLTFGFYSTYLILLK